MFNNIEAILKKDLSTYQKQLQIEKNFPESIKEDFVFLEVQNFLISLLGYNYESLLNNFFKDSFFYQKLKKQNLLKFSWESSEWWFYIIFFIYKEVSFKNSTLLITNQYKFSKFILKSLNLSELAEDKKILLLLQKLSNELFYFLKCNNIIDISYIYFPLEGTKKGRWKKVIFLNSCFFDEDLGLNKLFIFYFNLPMVHPPKDWNLSLKIGGYLTNNNNHKLIHSIKNGVSKIKLSVDGLKSINLVQQKGYKINNIALKIFLKYKNIFLYLLGYDLERVEFLKKQIQELEFFLSRYITDCNYLNFLTKNKNIQKQILKKKKLSSLVIDKLHSLSNYKIEYRDLKLKYKLFSYSLNLAKILKNEIIYFPCFLDFRLRNYSSGGWSLHRTSGFYKFLLDGTDKYEVTDSSISILKKYICKVLKINFVGNCNCLSIKNWIINNYYKKLSPETFLRVLLYLDILTKYYSRDTSKPFYSFLLFELDMVASGCSLYSLLCKNNKIASSVNLIKESEFELNRDLYCLVKEESYKVLVKKGFKSQIKMIYFERPLLKKAVMQIYYGLGLKKFISLVLSFSKVKLIPNVNIFCSTFYQSIINYSPDIFKFMGILKKVAKCTIKYGYSFVLSSGDNCSIDYKYKPGFKTQSQTYIDKRTGKKIVMSLLVPIINKKKDLKVNVSSFPPNLIHSIDSFLVRDVIKVFYFKTRGVILEPIHDAFRFPLNKYDTFIKIFKSQIFNNFYNPKKYLNKILWQPLLKNKNIKYQEELKKLRQDYYKILDKNKNFDLKKIKNSNSFLNF